MLDRWVDLRKELSDAGWMVGNTEPEVELIGLTCPGWTQLEPNTQFTVDATVKNIHFSGDTIAYSVLETEDVESQVAQAAAVSSGVEPKDVGRLNKHLIKMGHLTPLEAIQYNFHVIGISKACSAQASRHRIGSGHVSKSRRFQAAEMGFVYPLLNKVERESEATHIYKVLSGQFLSSQNQYNHLRNDVGLNKTEARLIIPVASATERIWWMNARSLRSFLELRLAPDAEAEIRRLSFMLLDIVSAITPSLFEDISLKYKGENNV